MRFAEDRQQRLAIFDFDGTLCSRNSYHVLIKNRLQAGWAPFWGVGFKVVLRRLGLVKSEHLKRKVVAEFKGWSRDKLADFGQFLYKQELRPFLRPAALEELKRCRIEGLLPVVVSGAFDFFVQPFCAEHEIDVYVCTQLAFSLDVCLGCLQEPEMRAEHKRTALRQLFSEYEIDWEGSCAFTDELSDLPLLEMVGRPCLVNRVGFWRHSSPQIQQVRW
jgi:HAD superfamily hydrolase (TIGR01490 family)